MRPRARPGTPPSPTGARCQAIRTRCSTARSRSTSPRSRRRSPGAPAPSMWSASTGASPIPATVHDASGATRCRRRSTTWTSSRRADRGHAGRLGVHRLLHQQPHLGPARRRRGGERAQGGADRAGLDRAGLRERQAPGGGRGARPGVQVGRLRVARARLLDVPRHEQRDACRRASAASRPRTATSSAARGRAHARIWPAPPWPRPRRSAGTSSTCASWRHRKLPIMDPLTKLVGPAAPMLIDNVNTDTIAPMFTPATAGQPRALRAVAGRVGASIVRQLALRRAGPRTPGLCAQSRAIPVGEISDWRREFRLRLLARYGAQNAERLWHPVRRGAELRRHISRQLLQNWHTSDGS